MQLRNKRSKEGGFKTPKIIQAEVEQQAKRAKKQNAASKKATASKASKAAAALKKSG